MAEHVRVLVVDDEPHIADVITIALRHANEIQRLRAGDALMTKPVSLDELTASVRDLAKRASSSSILL